MPDISRPPPPDLRRLPRGSSKRPPSTTRTSLVPRGSGYRRQLAAVGFVVLVGFLLAACGGGKSGDTAVGTTSSAPRTRTSLKGRPVIDAGRLRRERRGAGAAAAFVHPGVDNSVPTFGHESGGAGRTRAEVSLGHFLRAREAEAWDTVCADLAVPTRQALVHLGGGGKSCAKVVAGLSRGEDLRDPQRGPLVALRVSGRASFLLFYGARRQQYIMPARREGNRWGMTQPAPIAYPPGTTG